MRVIAKRTLREFWDRVPATEQPLLAWFREAEKGDWRSPAEVKEKYGNASFVGDRIVFNIKGGKYRLVVRVDYPHRIFFIRFIGTHKEYDAINVEEV